MAKALAKVAGDRLADELREVWSSPLRHVSFTLERSGRIAGAPQLSGDPLERLVAARGGQAMCATCHVYVRPAFAAELPSISDDEDEMLDCTTAERTDASRLGCQVKMSGSLATIVVDVPSDQV